MAGRTGWDEDKWLFFLVILILAGGIFLVIFTAGLEDNRLRNDQLVKTRFMERGIRYEQVQNLTGTASDLYSADYAFLKWQMAQMRSADPHIRFTYLLGKHPDGSIVFLVDSEPPDSEEYSPPGQVFPEASYFLESMFLSPDEMVIGPYPDRWGTWISALVPLIDPMTGEVIAVYGIDVDATDWFAQVIIACIPVIVGVLVLVLILLIFVNIRRRDRREKEILEESETRLYDIINLLPDPTFAIDLEGKVISWNRAMEEMTGVPADEMLGKGNHEYALPFYSERRPLLIDLISQPDEVIAKDYTNIVREKGFLIADTSLPKPRGRSMWLMGKAGPLYNREGTVVGAIESIRDLTSRKKAEEALRKSEERFRSYVENANDIIYSLTPDGIFTYVSPKWTELLGHDAGEVIGKPFDCFIHPDDLPAFHEFVRQVLTTGLKKRGIEYRIRHHDGTWQWHTTTASPLCDDAGKVFSFLGISQDITERRRIEEEKARHTAELKQYADALARTNSKLNLMNSITRHDILNQITAITGYLDLMNTTVTDPELRGFIQPALLASENIGQYIRFSKEYQEIGVRSPGWFPVRSLIASAASGLTLAPVRLIIDIRDLEIFADPLLEKVFYTLLENALRHAKGITRIRFSCHRSGTSVVITCEDDGPGVPPQYKEKIFDRGYFLHTGYGLFLSREILAITGITIRETGEYTKGARFEMIVPEGAYRFTGTD